MKRLIIFVWLIMLFSATVAAADKASSKVLARMFAFQENYKPDAEGRQMDVYTKHYYQTYRRNIGLWLIPSMYTIARGQRRFVSEQYDRLTLKGNNLYNREKLVFCTTIPHNRTTMDVLEKLAIPNLYSPTLYGDHLLSPICRENRHFYRYKVSARGKGMSRIDFKPLVGDNTQLVRGTAIVENESGRIIDIVIDIRDAVADLYDLTLKSHGYYRPSVVEYPISYLIGKVQASSSRGVFYKINSPEALFVMYESARMDLVEDLLTYMPERCMAEIMSQSDGQ